MPAPSRGGRKRTRHLRPERLEGPCRHAQVAWRIAPGGPASQQPSPHPHPGPGILRARLVRCALGPPRRSPRLRPAASSALLVGWRSPRGAVRAGRRDRRRARTHRSSAALSAKVPIWSSGTPSRLLDPRVRSSRRARVIESYERRRLRGGADGARPGRDAGVRGRRSGPRRSCGRGEAAATPCSYRRYAWMAQPSARVPTSSKCSTLPALVSLLPLPRSSGVQSHRPAVVLRVFAPHRGQQTLRRTPTRSTGITSGLPQSGQTPTGSPPGAVWRPQSWVLTITPTKSLVVRQCRSSV
jgi:hypothetical protein